MKLEAHDISVVIRDHVIVSNASIEVASGELVGLIGPNGAGKSTLLRALIGLAPRASGRVHLDGQDLFSLPARTRAQRIAFLSQERRVEWRLPVRDVVMLGRYPHQRGFGGPTPQDRAAVDRALASVDGGRLADRPAAVLSGGERTRILLARALAVEAPLLIVDEPIAALDPYHQLHVMEILRERARLGAGVLAVIHDLSLATRFMDRVLVMDNGRIVGDGPPAEVLNPALLATVYRIRVATGVHQDTRFLVPWSRQNST